MPTGVVTGTVSDDTGRPIRSAWVGIVGHPGDLLSNARGGFTLRNVPSGPQSLRVIASGYRMLERPVDVPAGATVEVNLVLPADPVALDALTVTGTMTQTTVSRSPVKVSVVPSAVLGRNVTNNLTEAIQYVNGLYNQVDCGVCYTNSIRINGMEGPYTAVLIDGMPLMSSLASVYGLNGISPAMIEQIEIIKGPSSTLYGSEAMGGVINVITKDPRFMPRFSMDLSSTSDLEGNVDLAVALEPGDVSGFVSGNLVYNSRFVDENGDGFSDFPLLRRGVVFGKLDVAPEGRRRAALSAAKYLYEDRFGGVEGWTRRLRGSGEVYGESIFTHRAEFLASYILPERTGLRFEGSFTRHDQDSWYGDAQYAAEQSIAFGSLLWSRPFPRHEPLLGVTARWQSYDDSTPATVEAERRFIPGVFAQDEL